MNTTIEDIQAAQVQFLQEAWDPRLEKKGWTVTEELGRGYEFGDASMTHLCWTINSPARKLSVCFTMHKKLKGKNGAVQIGFSNEEEHYWFTPSIKQGEGTVWQEMDWMRPDAERPESEKPFRTSQELISFVVDRVEVILAK